MDIISHGLWGSLAFGRKNRRSFWLSFCFGVLPDVISFGPYFFLVILGFLSHPPLGQGHPSPEQIPAFVHVLYSFSHSLIIFFLIFLAVSFVFRRPIWEMSAWLIHILLDVFTHSLTFFPTPVFWPVADFNFDGIPWSEPVIFLPNVILLAVSYVYFFVYRKRVV